MLPILLILLVFSSCDIDRNISVEKAHKFLGHSDILFLDVRTRQECVKEGRIKNALLIPVSVLERRLAELEQHREKKIIVYCRTDRRSQIATDILISNDFNAFKMDGGFLAWKEYSRP